MRHAPGRRHAGVAWLLSCFLAVFVSGCLTLKSTVRPDGSSTIDVRYQVDEDTTVALEKARFTSPHFTVQDVTVDAAKKEAHVVGTLDAVSKLQTVPFFKTVAVTEVREGARETLTLVVTKAKTVEVPKGRPGPEITLTLPGPVGTATPTAEVKGDTVTWRFPLDEFAREKTTTMTVAWTAPSDAKAGAKDGDKAGDEPGADTAKPEAKPKADAKPATP
jgi:hypothetical protein